MFIFHIYIWNPTTTNNKTVNKIIKKFHKENLIHKNIAKGLKIKSNRCKRVLEAAKLAYATKTKQSITSQKLGSRDFWRIANSVLNKSKSAIPFLFNRPEVLSSASDKAKLFAKNFSKNSNLDDSGISLPVFPSRTNLKKRALNHHIYLKLKLHKEGVPGRPVISSVNCHASKIRLTLY